MTITYIVNQSLYVNVTNKCSNRCDFCVRNGHDSVNEGDNLWLEREPTKQEILEDIEKRDINSFKELCFCGFGEPTYRIRDIAWVLEHLKGKIKIPVRINTNGHANRINGEDVTPLFAGLIDICSISLNQKNAIEYDKTCKSIYGLQAFDEMLDFTQKVKKYVPRVILSVVDTIGEEDVAACREIAQKMQVEFRVRTMIQ